MEQGLIIERSADVNGILLTALWADVQQIDRRFDDVFLSRLLTYSMEQSPS